MRGGADLHELLSDLGGEVRVQEDGLRLGRNHVQEVVEVMGDPAGNPAQRLHLLGVQELLLERRVAAPLLARGSQG